MRDPEAVAVLRGVMDTLTNLPGAVRQAIVDAQWGKIPVFVCEENYAATLATGVPLDAPPQYNTLELITSVVVTVPVNATGLLQIGATLIPVGSGTTVLAPIKKVLQSTDARRLTITGDAGPAAIFLTGEQLPSFGVMGP